MPIPLRSFALMMPEVTVPGKPKGLPTASTHWPTSMSSEFPMGSTGSFFPSILITATSVCVSTPMTLASNSRPSLSFTFSLLAPLTTCALVRMYPSLEMMNPDPWPTTGGPAAGRFKPRKLVSEKPLEKIFLRMSSKSVKRVGNPSNWAETFRRSRRPRPVPLYG